MKGGKKCTRILVMVEGGKCTVYDEHIACAQNGRIYAQDARDQLLRRILVDCCWEVSLQTVVRTRHSSMSGDGN